MNLLNVANWDNKSFSKYVMAKLVKLFHLLHWVHSMKYQYFNYYQYVTDPSLVLRLSVDLEVIMRFDLITKYFSFLWLSLL